MDNCVKLTDLICLNHLIVCIDPLLLCSGEFICGQTFKRNRPSWAWEKEEEKMVLWKKKEEKNPNKISCCHCTTRTINKCYQINHIDVSVALYNSVCVLPVPIISTLNHSPPLKCSSSQHIKGNYIPLALADSREDFNWISNPPKMLSTDRGKHLEGN